MTDELQARRRRRAGLPPSQAPAAETDAASIQNGTAADALDEALGALAIVRQTAHGRLLVTADELDMALQRAGHAILRAKAQVRERGGLAR